MNLWNSILSATSLSTISGWLAGAAIVLTLIFWLYRRRIGHRGSAKMGAPAELVDDLPNDAVAETPAQIFARFDGLTNIQAKQRKGLYIGKTITCECVVSDARHFEGGISVFTSARGWGRDVYVSVDYPEEWKAEAAGLRVRDRILVAGRITDVDPPILSIQATQAPRVR